MGPLLYEPRSPEMPTLENADLLFAADCTAFSFGGFHRKPLAGKAVNWPSPVCWSVISRFSSNLPGRSDWAEDIISL